MKKIPIIFLFAFVFTAIQANNSNLAVNNNTTSIEVMTKADVDQLAERVYEINSMDISTLNSTERYALKYELLQIKSKLNGFFDNGGIYIGGGTLLIVIILLILLL